ncbi:hypothetical protein NMY22_g20152 [Coprinellus aureogranulatus]|nr:hypothetical protein NMY22_g20152 [Coprinellus aureogranulatus]
MGNWRVIPAYTETPTSAVLFRLPSPNLNMRGVTLASVCAGFVASATAQTVSLYLPLFDPQPLTADVAGVGAGGQTTWLVRGSGGPEGGFIGTATLVQGPTGASFTFASPEATGLTLGYECTFEGENAVCSGADEDGTVVTETDSIEFLDVTLGTTVPGAQVTSAPDASTTSSAGTASTTSSRMSTLMEQGSETPEKVTMVAKERVTRNQRPTKAKRKTTKMVHPLPSPQVEEVLVAKSELGSVHHCLNGLQLGSTSVSANARPATISINPDLTTRNQTFYFPKRSNYFLLQEPNITPKGLYKPTSFLWDPLALCPIPCPVSKLHPTTPTTHTHQLPSPSCELQPEFLTRK